jgi:hypothetical protein
MKQLILAVLLVSGMAYSHAQTTNVKDSVVNANLIMVEGAIGFPGADLADRFGFHGMAGAGWQAKTDNNWLIGFSGHYLFGNVIHEDSMLINIKNEDGYVIGNDGGLYNPVLFEQGFDLQFQVGKITDLWQTNPNSGLTIMGGVGFFQHNIQIYIDEAYVPQLNDVYKKGYDRLSNGIIFSEFVGYTIFGSRQFVNFRTGLEFSQAFTKGRRGVTFDTLDPQEETRLDLMINLKVAWILPIYEKPERRYYTY